MEVSIFVSQSTLILTKAVMFEWLLPIIGLFSNSYKEDRTKKSIIYRTVVELGGVGSVQQHVKCTTVELAGSSSIHDQLNLGWPRN